MNKQIAHELSVTEVTVKLHRCNVMRKKDARVIRERHLDVISMFDIHELDPLDLAQLIDNALDQAEARSKVKQIYWRRPENGVR